MTELKNMIVESCKAVASFRHRQGIFDSEDFMYERLIAEGKENLKKEIDKAKKWQQTLN